MVAVPKEEGEYFDIPIIFDLACSLQDWGLCGAIILRSLTFSNNGRMDDEETFGDDMEAGTPLDPMTMNFEVYKGLPVGVAWALARASLKLYEDAPKSSEEQRKSATAREFVRLMQLKG